MRDKAQMVAYQAALVEPAGELPVNILGNHTAHMIAYEPTGPLARCENATVGRISRFRVTISEHCPGILLTWPARGWLIGDRAMWLVLYVATIASLSALSLLPTLTPLAPITTDEDRVAPIEL
jgi:hypothetical protein